VIQVSAGVDATSARYAQVNAYSACAIARPVAVLRVRSRWRKSNRRKRT